MSAPATGDIYRGADPQASAVAIDLENRRSYLQYFTVIFIEIVAIAYSIPSPISHKTTFLLSFFLFLFLLENLEAFGGWSPEWGLDTG